MSSNLFCPHAQVILSVCVLSTCYGPGIVHQSSFLPIPMPWEMATWSDLFSAPQECDCLTCMSIKAQLSVTGPMKMKFWSTHKYKIYSEFILDFALRSISAYRDNVPLVLRSLIHTVGNWASVWVQALGSVKLRFLSTAFNPTAVWFTSRSSEESDVNPLFRTFQCVKYF